MTAAIIILTLISCKMIAKLTKKVSKEIQTKNAMILDG